MFKRVFVILLHISYYPSPKGHFWCELSLTVVSDGLEQVQVP